MMRCFRYDDEDHVVVVQDLDEVQTYCLFANYFKEISIETRTRDLVKFMVRTLNDTHKREQLTESVCLSAPSVNVI
jgi:hypothetical protein